MKEEGNCKMNNSCDNCIYAELVETVNECYMICTNKNYAISFPDYIGKCKYQVKKEKKEE